MDEAGTVIGGGGDLAGSPGEYGRRRWIALAAAVVTGVGTGLLLLATWAAAAVLAWGTPNASQHSYGTRGETRFTDVRVPIAGGVIVVSTILLLLVVLLLVARSRTATDLLRGVAISTICGIVVLVAAGQFTNLLTKRTDDWGTEGSGYPGTVLAWWLAIFGLAAVGIGAGTLRAAALRRAEPAMPKRWGALRVPVGIGAVVALAVGLITIGFSPVDNGTLTVEKGDLVDVDDSRPSTVSAPGRMIEDAGDIRAVVGPGYITGGVVDTDSGDKTADIVMHNLPDSSERWRIRIPDDIYTSADIVAFEGDDHLIVRTWLRHGATVTHGVDAFTGDIVWTREDVEGTGDTKVLNDGRTNRFHLLDVSHDKKSVTAVDTASGRDRWMYSVPALCRLWAVADRPTDVLVIEGCPDTYRLVRVDAKSGDSRVRESGDRPLRLQGILEVERDANVDGVRFVGEHRGEDFSVVDSATGKAVGDSYRLRCDAGYCLTAVGGESDREQNLKSLTGGKVPTSFRDVSAPIGRIVVLDDVVVWTSRDGAFGGVSIGDRSTGAVTKIPGDFVDPQVVAGGVYVSPRIQPGSDSDDGDRPAVFLPGVAS